MPSSLLKLLQSGTLQEIKDYVKEHPESVRQKEEETGRIALHDAVEPFVVDGVEIMVGLTEIRFILEEYPEGAAVKDKKGQLALHVAAAAGDLDGCRLLLQCFPGATRVRDSKGFFPLHIALVKEIFPEVAEYLLEHHFGEIDVSGIQELSLSPLLHFALEYETPTAFIRALLQKAPQCATIIEDEYKDLPLHSATAYRAPLEQIQLILDANPSAIRQRNKYGSSPLHLEALHGARPDVVTLLLERFPEGVRVSNERGMLPIHTAFRNKTNTLQVLNLLNDAYPEGLSEKSKKGLTALHYSVGQYFEDDLVASDEVVSWVLEKNPSLISVVAADGTLPLHAAASNSQCSVAVLKLLIEKYPMAMESPDNHGDLPLHRAVYRGDETQLERIQFLLGKNQKAASVQNKKGRFPMHIACETKASMDVVSLLVKAHPQGRRMYDDDGRLPIHLAIENDTDVSIVELLLTQCTESDNAFPAERKLAHPLLYACEKNASLEVIAALVRNSVEILPSSTGFVGTNGAPTLACVASLRSRRKRRKLN